MKRVCLTLAILLLAVGGRAWGANDDLRITFGPSGQTYKQGVGLPLTMSLAHRDPAPVTSTVTATIEYSDVLGTAYSASSSVTFTVTKPVTLKSVRIPFWSVIKPNTLKLDGVAVTLDPSGVYLWSPAKELAEGSSTTFAFTIQ